MTAGDIAFHVPTVLLPAGGHDMTAWSVIACDQYTSQPEYWEEVRKQAGDAPSTLHMILPEAHLHDGELQQRIEAIRATMRGYLHSGVFQAHGPGLIRVARRLQNGMLRRGLVTALDLEAYDYRAGSSTLIRATEGTVTERLPPRARIREQAPLEVPHVMVLIDDPAQTLIEPLFDLELAPLYDFDLMRQSGRITGALLQDPAHIARVVSALRALASPAAFAARYGVSDKPVLLYAMGDGNHSFATARLLWERIKARGEATAQHPARFSLVELVNVHDPALVFEPIHRLVSGIDAATLRDTLRAFLEQHGARCSYRPLASAREAARLLRECPQQQDSQSIACVSSCDCGLLTIEHAPQSIAAGSLQLFLDSGHASLAECRVDYIHGEEALSTLAAAKSRCGLLLAAIAKQDLFRTIVLDGMLPKKTFSMGAAEDKRFYLECRRITA